MEHPTGSSDTYFPVRQRSFHRNLLKTCDFQHICHSSQLRPWLNSRSHCQHRHLFCPFGSPARRVTNKFYAAGEQRPRVKEPSPGSQPRYDLINDLQAFGLHRAWKQRLLKLGSWPSGERALNSAAARATSALALAHQGLEVVGVDFSEPHARRGGTTGKP